MMENCNIKNFKELINSGDNNYIYCSENNDIDKIKINITGSNNNINIQNIKIEGVLNININGNNNNIEINEDCVIRRSLFISIYPGGPNFKGNNCHIILGKKNFFNGGNVSFECGEENTSIKIGDDCLFAQNVKLTTTDNHIIYLIENGERVNHAGDITIGNHVWFCEYSSILNNSKIGNNSIVATRSVVTGKHFSDNVCVGGIPAKIIKKGVSWKA